MSKTVEELRAELRAAERVLEAARLEARKSVREIYTYTLVETPESTSFREPLIDGTTLYKFRGEVTNKSELEAVGKVPFGVGATYLFLWDIERFVMSTGGGSFNTAAQSRECWEELSSFIMEHPAGGDVTEIVRKYEKS